MAGTKKIILLKTAVVEGKHYPPESIHVWAEKIANELIDKDAAEPVLDVKTKSEGKSAGKSEGKK